MSWPRSRSADGVLSVGANVTWAQLEAFARGKLPEIHALTAAVRLAADPQRRHAGRQHRPRLAGRRFTLFPDDRRGRAGIGERFAARAAWPIKDFHPGPKADRRSR